MGILRLKFIGFEKTTHFSLGEENRVFGEEKCELFLGVLHHIGILERENKKLGDLSRAFGKIHACSRFLFLPSSY